MGYYSNRICFSIEGDEPRQKPFFAPVPEQIKIPEWFDEYSSQLLDGEISDECVVQMEALKGLRALYNINNWETFPPSVWPNMHDPRYAAYMYVYNVLLATNYLLCKRKEKSPDLNVIYQTAFWLMPPVNEYDRKTFMYVHSVLSALLPEYGAELSDVIQKKVMDAILAYDLREIGAEEDAPCKIVRTADNKLFELMDVGGGKTDILMPVFTGMDSALFECKLVPTSQAVVNNLRGYVEPKCSPLPQYTECGNVASVHFVDDFRQFILPDYAYVGKASISAYLNGRVDDTPDNDNLLDTFYKFVKVKETSNGAIS